MDWNPRTQRPPNLRSLASASFRPSMGPRGVELVDGEPEELVSFWLAHGFVDGESHPGADDRAQCCDFVGSVGQK